MKLRINNKKRADRWRYREKRRSGHRTEKSTLMFPDKYKRVRVRLISRLVFPGFGKRVRLHRDGESQYIYQP